MNDYSSCTIEELWYIYRVYFPTMDDDDRDAWQKEKDKRELQELKRQKQIMIQERETV